MQTLNCEKLWDKKLLPLINHYLFKKNLVAETSFHILVSLFFIFSLLIFRYVIALLWHLAELK